METACDSSKSDLHFSTSSLKHTPLSLKPPTLDTSPSSRSGSTSLSTQELSETNHTHQFSHDSSQISEAEYWKRSYLKLERLHQSTIDELNRQLQIKQQEIEELQNMFYRPQRMIKSQGDECKRIYKSVSVGNQGSTDELMRSVEFPEQDSIVDSLNPREMDMENQIALLNTKLEEMEIEKRYSEIKEEQWMASSLSLDKEIKKYKSKQEVPRLDKSVNTQGVFGKALNPETQQFPIDYVKSRLLRLMESSVRITKQLQEDSPSSQIKSAISTSNQIGQPSEIGMSKILKKPLNLSEIKWNKNNGSMLPKTDSDRTEKGTLNKTISLFATPTKPQESAKAGINKTKWEALKKSLEELKGENKVLRNYMEMK